LVIGLPVTVIASQRDEPSPSAAGPVHWGVVVHGDPASSPGLDEAEAAAGKRAGIVMWYEGWARHDFQPAVADAIVRRGSLAMITWEPWDAGSGVDQPRFSLGRIAAGDHDDYIRRWAAGVRDWGRPLLLRFAHEMNGDWYPWAAGVNGNTAPQFVAAWRHVHDVFRDAGATNVSWVWSPNVVYRGSAPLTDLYPGDPYVDWVAADGYNGGTALHRGGWRSFDQLFGATLKQLRALSEKPVMVAEVASAEIGGDKARWIEDFFRQLRRRPYIRAFVWFNLDKETDWRVQSSEAARAAFAAGVADPRYPGEPVTAPAPRVRPPSPSVSIGRGGSPTATSSPP